MRGIKREYAQLHTTSAKLQRVTGTPRRNRLRAARDPAAAVKGMLMQDKKAFDQDDTARAPHAHEKLDRAAGQSAKPLAQRFGADSAAPVPDNAGAQTSFGYYITWVHHLDTQ